MATTSRKANSRTNQASLLIQEAIQAAATVRQQCDVEPFSPVSVYDLCEKLGVTVRFAAVNMEGMYDKYPVPRIHLSSLRPMGRRAFTCAHELGHHYFKHGTTVDRLITAVDPAGPRNEALANVFAANLLMPAAGLKMALTSRGIEPSTLSALQAFALSTMFGVGYGTLLRQLCSGLGYISEQQLLQLCRQPPVKLTKDILGAKPKNANLKIVDANWGSGTIDVERGDILLCPEGTVPDGVILTSELTLLFPLFTCSAVGLARIHLPGAAKPIFVRIQERRYVGLAKFRHLEAED